MLREGDPPSSVPLLFNEELMDAFGLSRSEGLARTVTRRFSEKMGFRPYPEVCGVLGSLSRHYRLGAISNWSLSTPLDDVLSEHGMLDYFEYTLASNEIGIEKPDPHIFHHALTRMGVEPAHAYYVGDAYIEDVVGAARAGLRPIHIVRGGGTSDAQVSITDLGELYAVIGAEGRP
jgi:putative hydrolase of the HAD superfamily